MKWRNPEAEMPENNQIVWVMLEAHKDRGSLEESGPSIEIVCGWAFSFPEHNYCRIENMDELGHGGIGWHLGKLPDGWDYTEPHAVAWMPVNEMVYPDWL